MILGRFEGIIEDGFTVDFIVDCGASKGWFCSVVIDDVSGNFSINNNKKIDVKNRVFLFLSPIKPYCAG